MNKKKGFTLVEILAVVIILGVISIIVYPVLNKVLKDNRKRAFEASLNAVVRAAELYKTDNNNVLGIVDYDDETIDISNLGKWQAGTLTDSVDTDGNTKIYLTGFYDGEFCATGYEGNFTIIEGKCVETPELCFIMKNNEIIQYEFDYSACPTNVNIPTSIDGQDVLYIGEGVFESSPIASVIIPNSIKEIRDNAFNDSALTSLDLTNATSLQIIGSGAFEYTHLTNVDFTNLTSLVEIKGAAFEYSGLTGTLDLTNSTNLTRIWPYSFEENQISSVKLSGLTHLEIIGNNAFEENNITGVLDLTSMPALTSLDDGAFSNNNITSINLTGTNVLESIGQNAFAYNDITNINVDTINNIMWLGAYAFAYNDLTSFSLTLFPNIDYVSAGVVNDNQLSNSEAFIYNVVNGTIDSSILISYGGASRSNIVIPSTVVSIGENAFSSQNITSVDFSQTTGLANIDYYAFSYNNLTTITLPSTLVEIGQYAFADNQLVNVSIPENTTIIDDYAFYSNRLTSVTLPSTLLEIGQYAFSSNQLANITIPVNTTTIENYAFTSNATWQTITILSNGVNSKLRFNYAWTDIGWPMEKIPTVELLSTLSTATPNNFDFQNFTYYKVTVPTSGQYKFEVWGAQGGCSGGAGGYSTGLVQLNSGDTLYVYVGGKGLCSSETSYSLMGGWNGGGFAYKGSYITGSGGGATDIRIQTNSLYSRAIVAGGGGGYSNLGYFSGGVGGGQLGGSTYDSASYAGGGGTQVNGGISGCNSKGNGKFGLGGSYDSACGSFWGYPDTGGGSGWYGGGSAAISSGGGSGWVYTSTDFTNWQSGNATDAAQWLLNSSYYLSSAQTIAGNLTITNPDGSSVTGHTGNGYARITFIA